MVTATMPEGTQLEPRLTERQASFLKLADEGKSHREIAEEFGVSIGTVSSTIYFVRNRSLKVAGDRPLTARQLEILRFVGSGYNSTEIGALLFLSPLTVANHLRMARERLGARSSVHAVMLAISLELLILDHDGQLLLPHAHRVAA